MTSSIGFYFHLPPSKTHFNLNRSFPCGDRGREEKGHQPSRIPALGYQKYIMKKEVIK